MHEPRRWESRKTIYISELVLGLDPDLDLDLDLNVVLVLVLDYHHFLDLVLVLVVVPDPEFRRDEESHSDYHSRSESIQ